MPKTAKRKRSCTWAKPKPKPSWRDLRLKSRGNSAYSGGYKFVELGPELANKGKTIAYLLDERPWPNALPLFLGDDDKDEEAFEIIKQRNGMALLVNRTSRETHADARVPTPQDARDWLEALLARYPVVA